MSTMWLREMLSAYEDMIGTSTSEIGTGARSELEAIEKAAKVLDDNIAAQIFASNPRAVHDALDFFGRIADEFAQRNAGTAGLNDGLSGVRFGAGVIKVGSSGPQE